ncbi:hypothetical protein [Fimbriimonas ginsengisoli]|uniref:hypothetical protein n=1 Tax=Fimbriimonas ginsengisoli TaxID=1005039 RepID=UPI00046CA5B0|nr:hypothetical protein [Fimbriimonas ginsengisoli]
MPTYSRPRSWHSVLWFGTDAYVHRERGIRSTLRSGFAGWYAVLCIACPCLLLGVGWAVKGALWPEGRWAGLATVVEGMLLWGLVAAAVVVAVITSGMLGR